MKIKIGILLVFCFLAAVFSQTSLKRSRGEGLYKTINANTIGEGNIWIGFKAVGFLWDSDPSEENYPSPFAFPELKAEFGILDFLSMHFESRVLTYGWKFDWVSIGSKFTILDNKDIRLHTIGLKLDYQHRFLKNFGSSIAGYHNSDGTGFCPEGFIIRGGNIKLSVLYDIDLLSKFSRLPLKICTNLGINYPVSREFYDYSQYMVNFGLIYVGLTADVFIEYSLQAFAQTNDGYKKFDFYWPGWHNPANLHKVWEVAFSENPMHLSIGGRVRYANGLVLYGVVPLLLSRNKGSAMTDEDRKGLKQGKFPDEILRGITDPFDPWYPRWKIILEISYPIRYKRTSSEMYRNYILLKNRKNKIKIDIDERIELKIKEHDEDEEKDAMRRLEEIKKRREKIEDKDKK
jgi:hypothetical protein